jgi:hypothetical protein
VRTTGCEFFSLLSDAIDNGKVRATHNLDTGFLIMNNLTM